ncbi:SDR family oxidoreductase [Streptomyces sp. NPDC060065]|uniref:SDR family oxidoreductase n=1 Tax=Streptomyces sp. NPDC060065 TaxID=3347050 RepID=UPI0036D1B56E
MVPLTLDVTDRASIDAAVAAAADVTVLVNNAGATPPSASLLDVTEADIRANMETNFFGPVFLARAFAPILAAKQGSILIDVHSVASWYAFGGAYSASKAALWSATNSLRIELAPMGVHVTGVHMGYVDTDMAAHAEGPKMLPTQLVTTVYDAVEAGEYEVLADELTQGVKAALSGPVEALYPDLRGMNA